MMRGGTYRAHLPRRPRPLPGKPRLPDLVLRGISAKSSVSGARRGLHLVWDLPAGVPDAAIVEGLARRVRVGVYSFGRGGARWGAPRVGQRGLILGYAAWRQADRTGRRAVFGRDRRSGGRPRPTSMNCRGDRCRCSTLRRAGGSQLAPNFMPRPALARAPRAQTSGSRNGAADGRGSNVRRSRLYRYPIKG